MLDLPSGRFSISTFSFGDFLFPFCNLAITTATNLTKMEQPRASLEQTLVQAEAQEALPQSCVTMDLLFIQGA